MLQSDGLMYFEFGSNWEGAQSKVMNMLGLPFAMFLPQRLRMMVILAVVLCIKGATLISAWLMYNAK